MHTVEALLRWRQPDGNVVAPADFFEVAEHTGLITDISDWALRTAIQTAAHGRAARGRRRVWRSTSLRSSSSSGNFVERLQALLQQYSLPPQCLEIELTENVLQTGSTTIAALHRLRELGVSIALDDFGTGYSSLTSLERLPLTRVKIDRSLIATIDSGGRSPRDRALHHRPVSQPRTAGDGGGRRAILAARAAAEGSWRADPGIPGVAPDRRRDDSGIPR